MVTNAFTRPYRGEKAQFIRAIIERRGDRQAGSPHRFTEYRNQGKREVAMRDGAAKRAGGGFFFQKKKCFPPLNRRPLIRADAELF